MRQTTQLHEICGLGTKQLRDAGIDPQALLGHRDAETRGFLFAFPSIDDGIAQAAELDRRMETYEQDANAQPWEVVRKRIERNLS